MKGIVYCAISPSNKKYYGYTIKSLEKRKEGHYKDAVIKNSNKFFSKAIRKYGIENFNWYIVEEHYRETKIELHGILCEREIYWILKDKTYLPEFGYNMTKGGDGALGYKFTLEQYKKVCEFNKKLTDAQRGIPRTEEIKQKMSLAKKGKTYEEIYGEEKAEEMRIKRRNQRHTEESKQKIKNARKNRKPESEETKIKRRESNLGEKNPMFGKHLSDETKKKISTSTIGKKKPRKLVRETINI
jgi:group I intron endonuclease